MRSLLHIAVVLVPLMGASVAHGQVKQPAFGNPKSQPGAKQPVPDSTPRINFKNPRIPFSDEAVGKAIAKGVEYLLSKQQNDGSWNYGDIASNNPKLPVTVHMMQEKVGATALATYALMESGLTNQHEKIAKALKWLADPSHGVDYTYSVALSCQVWLTAMKQTRDKDSANTYKRLLAADVDMLVRGALSGGGYSYNLRASTNRSLADNSNCQYGLLGVWAGERAGLEIPREYWEKTLNYWLGQQISDGGWNYRANVSLTETLKIPATPSMTAAGIASLFVCIDASMNDRFVKCNAASEFTPIKKGLDWYAANFTKIMCGETDANGETINPSPGALLYTMYGIERIGLASGYKYFGDSDWYKMGCIRLLNEQLEDGSWKGPYGKDVSSSYALLFLVRGQRGVLLNRLEYDGDWNNRPRALANFCRWAENVYEQQEVNWQIVTLKSPVEEWHDAPILVISGSKTPKFSDEEIARLRTFVYQGGTIFSISECDGVRGFNKGMKEAYARMFPRYELVQIDKDHPLRNCHYKLTDDPAFQIVSNGVRPLAIHTKADLPLAWQTAAYVTGKANFMAAANVITYVTDRKIRNRGAKFWPDEPDKPVSRTIRVARIRYSGNYDPEPLAMQRLSRLLTIQSDLKLEFADSPATRPAGAPASAPDSAMQTGLAPTELTDQVRIAFMTGTAAFTLADKDKQALKKWAEAGGLLVIDSAGSSEAFTESTRQMLEELWGADSLKPLPLSSPIYQFKDMKLDTAVFRLATRVKMGAKARTPRLLAIGDGERPKVIFSGDDLTAAMVGYSFLGMAGYESESAFELMRNICLSVLPQTTTMPATSTCPASSQPASQPAAPPLSAILLIVPPMSTATAPAAESKPVETQNSAPAEE